jgi:pilus assembly protein CpaE
VAARIVLVESGDSRIGDLARQAGLAIASSVSLIELGLADRTGAPDLLLLDLRDQPVLPAALATLRRRNPSMSAIVVAAAMDPALMLEAMRAGVNEFVAEPLSPMELRQAVDRVLGQSSGVSLTGQVFAFVGAKGGVGTTTLAVNVAAALAEPRGAKVLMADLHIAAHGDASLLLGIEPRFSIVDAIENTHRLDDAFLKSLVARAKSAVDVLASPERPTMRPPDGDQVRALMGQLSAHYGTVVLDVPRTDLGVIDAIEPLTTFVMVVNQELPTVRRAAQIATILRQRYGKDRVAAVVSRYDARADIGQEDIERVVGLPVWAVLPSDYRNVIAAANLGKPLISEGQSRLATSVRKLAERLAGPGSASSARVPAQAGGLRKFF